MSQVEQSDNSATYIIGEIWAGTRPMPAAAMWGSHLIVAYYDAERWITIASLNIKTREVCRTRLPSQFAGWDAHNSLTMAISEDGILHLAGNAHASPLVYARGSADDIDSIHIMPMTGIEEDRSTYPTFLRASDNSILFYYRNGMSGNGRGLISHWKGGAWSRINSIFVEADRDMPTSAYPSSFLRAPDKSTHVAIVWRRTPDVSSNYAVSYAYTYNFQQWFGADKKPLKMPLSPAANGLIEEPGQHHGLVNAAHVILTPNHQPIVLYPRYGKDGNDAIIAARLNGPNWDIHEIAISPHRSGVAGGGAMTGLPNLSVDVDGWQAQLLINFPAFRHVALQLDLKSLATTPMMHEPGQIGSKLAPIPGGLANAAYISKPVLATGFDGAEIGRLVWFAEAPDRDRPLRCTPDAPAACSPPPSPLQWIVSQVTLRSF